MKNYLLPFLLIFLFSCNKASEASASAKEMDYEEATTEVDESVSSAEAFDKPISNANRKIIWSADMEFQVKNVDESTKNINKLVKKHNGFVSNMNLNSTHYRISNRIEIRINSTQFNDLINDIKGESVYMKNIEINSEDVTEEFVDIESRLKTKKEVRERYINILRNKTGDVKDVIAAEEAIRVITEEIEAKEGRLRYLKDKVSFSTIVLELFQEVEYAKVPSVYIKPYTEKLADGFSNGWSIITSILLGIVNIWPIILIISLIVWKRRWIASKFRK